MLRSFRFSNHRSFRDEAELLLLPVDDTRTALPVCAVFGGNASGKSNLLGALAFMAAAVRDSYARWSPNHGVPRKAFRLEAQAARSPSSFVVDVVIDSVRHVYGFVVDDQRVLEEWLYAYPRGRRRVILDRTSDKVAFGPAIGDHRSRAEVLRELTRPNALFLSLAAQVGQPEMASLYEWFTERLRFVHPTPKTRSVSSGVVAFLGEQPDRRRRLVDLMRAADLGLDDMYVDDGEYDVRYDDAGDPVGRIVLTRAALRFVHGSADAEPDLLDTTLDLWDESAGTVRWLWLLLDVLRCLEDGGTAVVDELDSSLHPELTAQLVRLFQDDEANPRGAQLLFTTHDATLLGTAMGEEILRRDQVWFVEKDRAGGSRLFPLSDFHPRRTGENRERRYLGGSYGGLPVLTETDFLAAVRARGHTDDRAS